MKHQVHIHQYDIHAGANEHWRQADSGLCGVFMASEKASLRYPGDIPE